MPTYLVLWNWTDQGIRNFKEIPKRVEAFRKLVEKNGGKLSSFFFTMGKYDGATVVEAPSDEVLMKIALGVGSLGNVRTTTLKAWAPTDMAKVINEM
jgi:uncharacterized protein with GYD domain